ncbi:phage shock protein PspC (stress-responsive transcriptional regulator) [Methanococcus maripaludis]|uniref:Phage shock protein PspC (Stress-responsive transcriptional regulator) n=1 Tax=Methanococcus maripaludis TaxID=39152 RepID=A0A7J9P2K3_METMI|nr:hypothetical protein [Methanococcus maripaludis]MBA2853664.1 phage shock protein PspC (stress-responsive transcriptional regulator) [Methanococcus maripaludis]
MVDDIKIIYLMMIGFTILGVGLSFKYYSSLDPTVRYIMHVFYVFALITATYLLAKSSMPVEQLEEA